MVHVPPPPPPSPEGDPGSLALWVLLAVLSLAGVGGSPWISSGKARPLHRASEGQAGARQGELARGLVELPGPLPLASSSVE